MSLVFFPLQGLMVSRYPGEDAVLGSHEVGNWNTPHPTSVLKLEGSFLPSPHPQVLSPVSRERIAPSCATSLLPKTDERRVKQQCRFLSRSPSSRLSA